MNSTGKVITGILAGAAAGAILGVLFAPDKGTETRKKISNKSSDALDAVKDRFNKLGDAISSKYERMIDDVKEAGENGREKLNSAKEAVKSHA